MLINNIEFTDFEQLWIYDVPLGTVLNKQTANTFPKKATDSYLWNKDTRYLLQKSYDENYEILFVSDTANSFQTIRGTLEEVHSLWEKHINGSKV